MIWKEYNCKRCGKLVQYRYKSKGTYKKALKKRKYWLCIKCENKNKVEQMKLREDNKAKFECSMCNGKGYTQKWEDTNYLENKSKTEDCLIEDCENCEGLGHLIIPVVDKRKVSKNKKLHLNLRY